MNEPIPQIPQLKEQLAEAIKPKKESKPKKKRGQQCKYSSINLHQLKKLAKLGFKDSEIADFFDISVASLKNYKNRFPTMLAALKNWKEEADEKVEKSLYKRALGYEYDEITYEKSKLGGLAFKLNEEEIDGIKHVETYKTKITTRHVPPDTTAQIFWLKNRQPEKWRDKSDIEHILPDSIIDKFATIPSPDLIKRANELVNGKK